MPKDWSARNYCSLCESVRLTPVWKLPDTPLANELVRPEQGGADQDLFPLTVVACMQCGHVQLLEIVSPARLFGGYRYATNTSPTTISHLNRQAVEIKADYERFTGLSLDEKSFVVEIGSNDGSMLKAIKGLGVKNVLGIDPAKDIAATAKDGGIPTHVAFFDRSVGHDVATSYGKADVVIANNVFAHVPFVRDMLVGAHEMLEEGGLLVFDVSYLLDMAGSPVFDTIYHEHTSYHHVSPLALVCDELGLPIVRAQRILEQLGRGSLRITCRKQRDRKSINGDGVRSLMLQELRSGLDEPRYFFTSLKATVNEAKLKLGQWLKMLHHHGHKIYGYGAAAKMTTLMYVFEIDPASIAFVVDDSPWKQGMLTPGHHLPIKAPGELHGKGGTCLLFAWNFADAIVERNERNGNPGFKGTWLVPLPELFEAKS